MGSASARRLALWVWWPALCWGLLSILAVAAADRNLDRPNIVLILTDDEDLALHATMPKTRALLEEEGVSFGNSFVTYSLCAPSRATIFRGQYPHNHKIEGNVLPSGGYFKYQALELAQSTVATWLKAAGYHTAIIGKYLNGYNPRKDPPAPGWTDWIATDSAYYNYVVNNNGIVSFHGAGYDDYAVDFVARRAVAVIERAVTEARPFFIVLAPYSPHSPAPPAPRYARGTEDAELARPPSFNEADVSDKPVPIRELPLILPERQDELEAYYRRRVRSMQAVDDLVERIVGTLQETGRLANTYIIYTSDNGLHMGEHRIVRQKTTLYEEAIRVPLLVRGPGLPAGHRIDGIVLNNDLAPTIAAMAGVEPPSFVDGRSFLGLMTRLDMPWRRSFVIERRETERHDLVGAATYDAIRTAAWVYGEYGSGERELYDLDHDPFQLQNLIFTADRGFVAALAQRLAELKNCAAMQCRMLEDLPIGANPPGAGNPD